MTTLRSICSTVLDLPPSCIAFCPSRPELFVVGTYFLHPSPSTPRSEQQAATNQSGSESHARPLHAEAAGSASSDVPARGPQKRTGSLLLFRLNGDSIEKISEVRTDFAILDIQWAPDSARLGNRLAVASSTGLLALYRLPSDEERLVWTCSQRVCEPEILVLSLTWHPCRSHVIGVTRSDGVVMLCESEEGTRTWQHDSALVAIPVHQHDLEAWTLAFAPLADGATSVLSGGDDVVLCCSRTDGSREATLLWQDRRAHEAGVTAILPISDELVITGSYDDHIRLIATPAIGRRQVLAALNLGGGVWRLKFLPPPRLAGSDAPSASASLVLLASCMHAGTRIVRLTHSPDQRWRFDVEARFEEHQSMNYGSDVQPLLVATAGSATRTIVSTSFYDRLLCLWRW